MSNFPLAFILVLGAFSLPLLPKKVRSTAFLFFTLLAFYFLVNLEIGTTLTVPFLNYELVLYRVDRLSLVFDLT